MMIEITAKIKGEKTSLFELLKHKGLSARMVKGGIVVELPVSYGEFKTYTIPDDLKGHEFGLFIDVAEEGGGKSNTGDATIVCGLSGKALKPYYVPGGGHLSCGIHAYFAVPEAVVTVNADRHHDDVRISINRHEIQRTANNGIAYIRSKKLWSGQPDELPNAFMRYEDAVNAAVAKSGCYHCRHAHYTAA